METQNHHLQHWKLILRLRNVYWEYTTAVLRAVKFKAYKNWRFNEQNTKSWALLRAPTLYSESSKVSCENIGTCISLNFFGKIIAINFYYLGYLNIEKWEEYGSSNMLKKKCKLCEKQRKDDYFFCFFIIWGPCYKLYMFKNFSPV